mmetsp:Transcript_112792/g.291612  ORF Transcript_112792/g.291612 Transcript_112792/m.291612 type:complete len:225 (-) Transcript_112792:543-1217(-)
MHGTRPIHSSSRTLGTRRARRSCSCHAVTLGAPRIRWSCMAWSTKRASASRETRAEGTPSSAASTRTAPPPRRARRRSSSGIRTAGAIGRRARQLSWVMATRPFRPSATWSPSTPASRRQGGGPPRRRPPSSRRRAPARCTSSSAAPPAGAPRPLRCSHATPGAGPSPQSTGTRRHWRSAGHMSWSVATRWPSSTPDAMVCGRIRPSSCRASPAQAPCSPPPSP